MFEMRRPDENRARLPALCGRRPGAQNLRPPLRGDPRAGARGRHRARLELDRLCVVADSTRHRDGRRTSKGHGVRGSDPTRKRGPSYGFDSTETPAAEPRVGLREAIPLASEPPRPGACNDDPLRFRLGSLRDGEPRQALVESDYRSG